MELLVMLLGTIALVLSAAVGLAYWLGRRLTQLKSKLASVENRLISIAWVRGYLVSEQVRRKRGSAPGRAP